MTRFARTDQQASDRIEVAETVEIARPPEVVMDFLRDPSSAVATGQFCTRAFRAPDTPVGEVGEQHVQISESDGLLVVDVEEVVEIDLPHRILTRNLTTPGDLRVAYLCEPWGEQGTRYTQQVSITVADSFERSITEGLFVDETRRVTQRIKELLEQS
jgi:hypothetical protein